MSKYPGVDKFVVDGHTYHADRTQTDIMPNFPHVGRQIEANRRNCPCTGSESEDLKGERENMPGKVDESKWDAAKSAAHKQYPKWDEDNPRFWKVVSRIYKTMGGEFSEKIKKSLDLMEKLDSITPTFIENHRTWLAALKKSGSDFTSPESALKNIGLVVSIYADMGGQLQKSCGQDSGGFPIEAAVAKGLSGQFDKAMGGILHRYTGKTPKAGGGWKYQYPQGQAPGGPKIRLESPVPGLKKTPAGKPAVSPYAGVIDKLEGKNPKEQHEALQNVSHENLSHLHENLKDGSSLKKVISEEIKKRQQQKAATKKSVVEKSQIGNDKEFSSFSEAMYKDVKKSLSEAHPNWDDKILLDRTEASLRQMFKNRK